MLSSTSFHFFPNFYDNPNVTELRPVPLLLPSMPTVRTASTTSLPNPIMPSPAKSQHMIGHHPLDNIRNSKVLEIYLPPKINYNDQF